MSEFWNMGGYAFYVWTSYGIAFVVLLANIIQPILQQRAALKAIRRKREQSISR